MAEEPIVELRGPIKAVHQFMDMTTEEVDYKVPETGETIKGKGCKPAMGHTFSSGTIDGPGLFSFEAGSKSSNNPLWDLVTNFVPQPSPEQKECHAEKSILISTGEVSQTKYTMIGIYQGWAASQPHLFIWPRSTFSNCFEHSYRLSVFKIT